MRPTRLIGVIERRADESVLVGVLVGVVSLSWVALWVWGDSPRGRFMHHEELGVPGHGGLTLAALFVSGWTLMSIAMMLPTSLPLVVLFHRMTRRRADRPALVALLVLGYLAVWGGSGLAAYGGDHLVHQTFDHSARLQAHSWLLASVTLTVAGLYQLSPLKRRCLARCRRPFGFLVSRWRGGRGWLRSFLLGLDSGRYCLGCCWPLMLLMFGFAIGNVAVMLLLTTIMTIEKNLPGGDRIAVPLGLLLVAWGLGIALATGLPGPPAA